MFDKIADKFRSITDHVKYAFAYLRVSTEEQTVLNQKLAMQKWAIEHDYFILD